MTQNKSKTVRNFCSSSLSHAQLSLYNKPYPQERKKKQANKKKTEKKFLLMFRAHLEELHREVFTEGLLQIFDYNN